MKLFASALLFAAVAARTCAPTIGGSPVVHTLDIAEPVDIVDIVKQAKKEAKKEAKKVAKKVAKQEDKEV
jgi:predicted CoA-binding protein